MQYLFCVEQVKQLLYKSLELINSVPPNLQRNHSFKIGIIDQIRRGASGGIWSLLRRTEECETLGGFQITVQVPSVRKSAEARYPGRGTCLWVL